MAHRILLVDDDVKLARLLADYLRGHGIHVEHREDGAEGIAALRREAFDGVVLDVMLPDLDGFDVLRKIRGFSDVPVLMLTARGEETDRIVGLELGADDYLPKPFNPRELAARLRAVLRRTRPSERERETALRFGTLEIDRAAREARVDGVRCPLTGHQFELLRVLAEHAGRVMSRQALMEMVKGDLYEAFDRAIDVHVSRIRAAIGDDPRSPRRILTYRGVGYMFVGTDEDPSR
jgi:DNA-binding response OmpR family regulator